MTRDFVQRFVFENTDVRGELVRLDASWQQVLARHVYPVTVREQLGQALAATVLLSATIKFRGSLVLQAHGEGPLTMLVAQVTSERTLRGLACWRGSVQAGTLQEMFGQGRLVMTVAPADGGERYQGIVALEGTNLAAALHTYFERSEQLSTTLWLAADQACAVGLLLQRLPGEHGHADIWRRAEQLAATVTDKELLRLPALVLLQRLFRYEDVRVFDPEPVLFRCTCSLARLQIAVRALGREESVDILREKGALEARCEFCNQHYELDSVDVEGLFATPLSPEVPTTRH